MVDLAELLVSIFPPGNWFGPAVVRGYLFGPLALSLVCAVRLAYCNRSPHGATMRVECILAVVAASLAATVPQGYLPVVPLFILPVLITLPLCAWIAAMVPLNGLDRSPERTSKGTVLLQILLLLAPLVVGAILNSLVAPVHANPFS